MTFVNQETLIRGFYEAFNEKDLDRMASLCADTVSWLDVPAGITFKGKEGVHRYNQGWLDAFPDGKVEILNLIISGDRSVVEFVGRGTHRGTFKSPYGNIPATGKAVEMRLCELMEIREGKIVKGTAYYDLSGFLAQLGQVPMRRVA